MLSDSRFQIPRFILALSVLAASAIAAAQQPVAVRWYKGNTHTHTLNSDGDSTPDDVVRWYRERRYHFVVITDHEHVTDVSALNTLHGADGRFVVIPGQEVTDRFDGKALHVNALGVSEVVQPRGGGSAVDVLQRNIDAVRAAGGVPHVNHPNFLWSLAAGDLAALDNVRLFELYNGHPQTNPLGGGRSPAVEELWDEVLSSGRMLYGVAVDDSHTFKDPWNQAMALPGRGWVMVRAARLDAREIVEAMDRGDFYASTGVTLEDYQATRESMTVAVAATTWSKYRIQFIGRGGRLLHESPDAKATYTFAGDEGYVRARVLESNGRMAWTQPVVVGKNTRW